MPPQIYSRFQFTSGLTDAASKLFLSDRVPYTFQNFSDNRQYVATANDSLFTIAARFFQGFARPAGLWWVIADFQPDPILDPTLLLDPGRVLIIPSIRTVQEEIFSERRRALS